jgi:hypothetical protein
LHRAATRGAPRLNVQNGFGRVTRDHRFSRAIRLLLIGVVSPADTILESNTASLLDDVRGFMGSELEIRLFPKSNTGATGVSAGSHPLVGRPGWAGNVGPDIGNIMMPKGLLNAPPAR